MKRRRFCNPFHGGIPTELVIALRKAGAELDAAGIPFVVIGGLSLSFHFPQYPTDDVDLAVGQENHVPKSLTGFKRVSPHMFEDRQSGVIVGIVTPKHIDIPAQLFQYAISTAIAHVDEYTGSVIHVAIPLAIFATKLISGRIKDQAHLMWMMRHGFMPRDEELLAIGVPLPRMKLYQFLLRELAKEAAEERKMGWGQA